MKKPPRLATDLLVLTLPAILAIAIGNVRHGNTTAARTSAAAHEALLARGESVAKAARCALCHTAAGAGVPFAGGLSMNAGLGAAVASNITPDPHYGIGRYSYEDFERAVKHGVAPGGRRLSPSMPSTEFSTMPDDDLRALYAYLMQRVAPVAKPPQPADVA